MSTVLALGGFALGLTGLLLIVLSRRVSNIDNRLTLLLVALACSVLGVCAGLLSFVP